MKVREKRVEDDAPEVWNDVDAESEGDGADLESEIEGAAKVASAIDLTEVVEPIRLAEAGKKKPMTLMGFRNPTDRPIELQMPDRIAIPPGKVCKFPSGYHRAIHRRAPVLECELGAACEVPRTLGQLA